MKTGKATYRMLSKWIPSNQFVIPAITFLSLVILCAFLAPWISNPSPQALVPYGLEAHYDRPFFSPIGEQIPNQGAEPLADEMRHKLGTDRNGRDILAGLIHGARICLIVGLLAMGLAGFIGLLLGAIAGFFGDFGIKISRVQLGCMILSLPLAWFYGFQIQYLSLITAEGMVLPIRMLMGLAIFIAIVLAGGKIGFWIGRLFKWNTSIYLPVDLLLSRLIEILHSIPKLLLLITVSALFARDLWLVMTVIGLLSWTGIARLFRAEVLRVKNSAFVEAGHALGYSQWRILFRHVIPNAIPPMLILLVIGIGDAIIAESVLSFLGILEHSHSWGNLLSSARDAGFHHWWVVLFPGLAIFFTVLSFNLLGEHIRDLLDPRTNNHSELTASADSL